MMNISTVQYNTNDLKGATKAGRQPQTILVSTDDHHGFVWLEEHCLQRISSNLSNITIYRFIYIEILRRFNQAVRPEIWTSRKRVLYYDNVPAHSSSLVRDFRTNNAMAVVLQPPYSPDLFPTHLLLFPKM